MILTSLVVRALRTKARPKEKERKKRKRGLHYTTGNGDDNGNMSTSAEDEKEKEKEKEKIKNKAIVMELKRQYLTPSTLAPLPASLGLTLPATSPRPTATAMAITPMVGVAEVSEGGRIRQCIYTDNGNTHTHRRIGLCDEGVGVQRDLVEWAMAQLTDTDTDRDTVSHSGAGSSSSSSVDKEINAPKDKSHRVLEALEKGMRVFMVHLQVI